MTCTHPMTRQRQETQADPDGEGHAYEVLVCLDCGRILRPKTAAEELAELEQEAFDHAEDQYIENRREKRRR